MSAAAPIDVQRSPIITELENDYRRAQAHRNLWKYARGAVALGTLAIGCLDGRIQFDKVVCSVALVALGVCIRDILRIAHFDETPKKIQAAELLEQLLNERFDANQATDGNLKAQRLIAGLFLLGDSFPNTLVRSKLKELATALNVIMKVQEKPLAQKLTDINLMLEETTILQECLDEVYTRGHIPHLEYTSNPTIKSVRKELENINFIQQISKLATTLVNGTIIYGATLLAYEAVSFANKPILSITTAARVDEIVRFLFASLFTIYLGKEYNNWFTFRNNIKRTCLVLNVFDTLPQEPSKITNDQEAEAALKKIITAKSFLIKQQVKINKKMLKMVGLRPDFLASPSLVEQISGAQRDREFVGKVQELVRIYLIDQRVILKGLRADCGLKFHI